MNQKEKSYPNYRYVEIPTQSDPVVTRVSFERILHLY